MSKRAQKKRDADDQFAKELDRKYENLITDRNHRSSTGNQLDELGDDRIESAMLILELLEELKPVRKRSNGAAIDTISHPSTKAGLSRKFGDPAQQQLESVIPDLQQLGRFKIDEQIGRGGYGVVVRAYDPELERDVAIKIPRFETALSADSRARFDRESKAAAALNHPGVVAVHETCSDQGIDFMVTELVDGENLATLLARGQKYSPPAAAELVADLADAVEHAHQRGVYHRDIKPSNILIEDNPSGGAKIADFGLASMTDQHDFTQTGAVVGTPAYMSPEQASGDKQAIGPHTDVYGLGTVLYQLLTGSSPFGDRSIVATLRAIAVEDPQPPHQLNRDVPKDLEAICMKCLEKNPAGRYESANALQSDLRRFLNDTPVQARRITKLDRAVRWARRNPTMTILATALLLALSVGLVVTTVLWRSAVNSRQLAEQNQTRFQLKSEQLEGVVDNMFDRIRQMPELGLQGMDSVREKMLADVNSYYETMLSEAPSNPGLIQKQADTMLRLAEIKSSLSDNQGAIEVASRLLDSIPKHATSHQVQQKIDALMLLATQHARLRHSDQQQKYYDDALGTARNVFVSLAEPDDDDRIEFAKSLSEAADIVGIWGDRTLSNSLARESIRNWETINPEELTGNDAVLALGQSYLIAAKTHAASENREVAREFARRSIEVIEQMLNDDILQTPGTQFLLADAYYVLGIGFRTELDKAMPELDKALLIATEVADSHPLVPKYQQKIAAINHHRGLTYYVAYLVDKLNPQRDGYLETALPIFEENIEFLNERRVQFPDSATLFEPRLALGLNMKGIIFGELGDYESQIESLDRALELANEISSQSKTQQARLRVLNLVGNFAFPLMKQGKYAKAIENLETAIVGLESMLRDDPDNRSASRYLAGDFEYLAECFTALNQHADALGAFRKSMQAYREGSSATMKGLEAFYLVRVGNYEDAKTSFEEFKAYQTGQASHAKLVIAAGRLISAIDEVSPSERQTSAEALRLEAARSAVSAIVELQQDVELDEQEFHELLDNPELDALKLTDVYQDWNDRR